MSCGQKCRIAENVVFIQVRERPAIYILGQKDLNQCVKERHSFERHSLAPLLKWGAKEECHSFFFKRSDVGVALLFLLRSGRGVALFISLF